MRSALHRSSLQDGSCLNSCAYACGLFHVCCEISITLVKNVLAQAQEKGKCFFSLCLYLCLFHLGAWYRFLVLYTSVNEALQSAMQ